MPLVEVIRGKKSSDETIAGAVAYAKSIGKSPIVVNDGPGFLVNRLLFPYMNEAIELLLEGADMNAIDRAAKNFGMPMGPITLFDVVGLDTAFYAGRVMYDAFPDRVVVSPLVPALIKAGRLGQNRAPASSPILAAKSAASPTRRLSPCWSGCFAASKSSAKSNSRRGCSCRCCWKPRGCWKTKLSATCATSI